MAAKKPNKKRKTTLDGVLSTVKRGFAGLEGKMDRGFAAVADDIASGYPFERRIVRALGFAVPPASAATPRSHRLIGGAAAQGIGFLKRAPKVSPGGGLTGQPVEPFPVEDAYLS
jgi:hypothetical protein